MSCRAVVGGSRPLFALTCRPSSGNPRGDRPWRCRNRPTFSPSSAPSHLTCSRPSPGEGSRRRRSILFPSCVRLLGLLVRAVAVPVECRELLTAAGVAVWWRGPCPVAVCAVLLRVWRTLARRPRSERRRGSGSAKAVRRWRRVLRLARCSSAGALGLSRHRPRGRPAGMSGSAQRLLAQERARVLLSGCARSGPRRRRGFRQEETARAATGCTLPQGG